METIFPIHETQLESQWLNNTLYRILPQAQKVTQKYFNKLYQYNTTLNQIQIHNQTSIIVLEQFKQHYQTLPKT